VVMKQNSVIASQTYVLNQGISNFTCGQNKWVPVQNVLQFYITNEIDCVLTLKTIDSIQLSMRFDTTVKEFFANNGPTTLIYRMAALLGIPAEQVRVTNVVQGSAIATVQVLKQTPTSLTQTSQAQTIDLDKAASTILGSISNGTLQFDYPLLNISYTVSVGGNATSSAFNDTIVYPKNITNSTTTTGGSTGTGGSINNNGSNPNVICINCGSANYTIQNMTGLNDTSNGNATVNKAETEGFPTAGIIALCLSLGALIAVGGAVWYLWWKNKRAQIEVVNHHYDDPHQEPQSVQSPDRDSHHGPGEMVIRPNVQVREYDPNETNHDHHQIGFNVESHVMHMKQDSHPEGEFHSVTPDDKDKVKKKYI